MNGFVEGLEDRCKHIVHNRKQTPSEPTPATFTVREMALLLDHIDTIRERIEDLKSQFLEKELSIDSEVLNLKSRPSLKNNWLEQTRLKNEFNQTLDTAERHMQQQVAENDRTLRQSHLRLLELLNMHDQLTFEHGDTKNTA